jgi:multiple sugar transport system substrate-binding protein
MPSNKLLLIAGGFLVIVFFLVVLLVLRSGFGPGDRGGQIHLEFWGVFDDPRFFTQAINAYAELSPGVGITYRNFSPEDYEREILDALATGQGPDIMYIHNTWLTRYKDKLTPLPQDSAELNLYGLANFRDEFVDTVFADLVDRGEIFAMPLYVDTLALYYNKDLLNSAAIGTPPSTWDEFNDAVERLTKLDARGRFTQSGAAIGTARNINRSTDIVMLLMLQSGVSMVDETKTTAVFSRDVEGRNAGEVALQYYTDFTDPLKRVYTWNDDQNYSIDRFVEGKTAMMFNYSYQIPIIREKAPRLNFGIAPMPQISGTDVVVNYANYWAPAVSLGSQFKTEAWKFLLFLASREGVPTYLETAKRPAARRDLIDFQKADLDLGVFATQALSARNWYQVDNGEIERIFADMIDDVNFGRSSVAEALRTAQNKVSVLMQRLRR